MRFWTEMTGAAEAGSTSEAESANAAAFETKVSPGNWYQFTTSCDLLGIEKHNSPQRHRDTEKTKARYFFCRFVAPWRTTFASRGRRILLGLREAFFKGYRNVAPDLDRQDYGCRQQERAYGYVRDGRNYHRKFWLDGVVPPGHAGQKCCEAQAQLRDQEREHENRGTADRFDMGIDRESANCGPGQHEGDHDRVQQVWPPAQAMVAEHGSQNELDIKDEDREQR